jgi:hypothetical protein
VLRLTSLGRFYGRGMICESNGGVNECVQGWMGDYVKEEEEEEDRTLLL